MTYRPSLTFLFICISVYINGLHAVPHTLADLSRGSARAQDLMALSEIEQDIENIRSLIVSEQTSFPEAASESAHLVDRVLQTLDFNLEALESAFIGQDIDAIAKTLMTAYGFTESHLASLQIPDVSNTDSNRDGSELGQQVAKVATGRPVVVKTDALTQALNLPDQRHIQNFVRDMETRRLFEIQDLGLNRLARDTVAAFGRQDLVLPDISRILTGFELDLANFDPLIQTNISGFDVSNIQKALDGTRISTLESPTTLALDLQAIHPQSSSVLSALSGQTQTALNTIRQSGAFDAPQTVQRAVQGITQAAQTVANTVNRVAAQSGSESPAPNPDAAPPSISGSTPTSNDLNQNALSAGKLTVSIELKGQKVNVKIGTTPE